MKIAFFTRLTKNHLNQIERHSFITFQLKRFTLLTILFDDNVIQSTQSQLFPVEIFSNEIHLMRARKEHFHRFTEFFD